MFYVVTPFGVRNKEIATFSEGLGALALLAEKEVEGTLYAEGGLPVAYTKDGGIIILDK